VLQKKIDSMYRQNFGENKFNVKNK